jgi:hypothetical protein
LAARGVFVCGERGLIAKRAIRPGLSLFVLRLSDLAIAAIMSPWRRPKDFSMRAALSPPVDVRSCSRLS